MPTGPRQALRRTAVPPPTPLLPYPPPTPTHTAQEPLASHCHRRRYPTAPVERCWAMDPQAAPHRAAGMHPLRGRCAADCWHQGRHKWNSSSSLIPAINPEADVRRQALAFPLASSFPSCSSSTLQSLLSTTCMGRKKGGKDRREERKVKDCRPAGVPPSRTRRTAPPPPPLVARQQLGAASTPAPHWSLGTSMCPLPGRLSMATALTHSMKTRRSVVAAACFRAASTSSSVVARSASTWPRPQSIASTSCNGSGAPQRGVPHAGGGGS